MSTSAPAEAQVRGVNLILLSGGGEIHLDDIVTAEEGQRVLDDIDGAILNIEDQLGFDNGSRDPFWRKRAESALKKKRRQRPAVQKRIAELRRAERRIAWPDPSTLMMDGKRKAFVKAAGDLLSPEVITEIWAHAAELNPSLFQNGREGE
ncbi:hypothetical protein MMB17_18405 [Methylobacterium organophilum]|uniref:hypothetical protein n=1 Tax=Methylobacterium organophilum TaxID=410 RepID=UPI001F12A316|nr:hypothetical protein [Methylobacterium organophilum]UMY16636.1 hypothetical protein MMB17_18405 [Methylobacterium organophilum]